MFVKGNSIERDSVRQAHELNISANNARLPNSEAVEKRRRVDYATGISDVVNILGKDNLFLDSDDAITAELRRNRDFQDPVNAKTTEPLVHEFTSPVSESKERNSAEGIG